MGTITTRRRKDGTTGYTAQIRLKHGGKVIHSESETFTRKGLAQEWMARREAALDAQRARGESLGMVPTLADLVGWYEGQQDLAKWGRTKAADLKRLKGYAIAAKRADRIAAGDFIAHIEERRRSGAGPATAGNDLIWLRTVMVAAKAAKATPVSLEALDAASHELHRRRTIGKSKRRSRRLLPEEYAALAAHFDKRHGPIPMRDLMDAALLTARREGELCQIVWPDVGEKTYWLRNVKHPRHKEGNDLEARLLPDALALFKRQPRTDDPRVFPFEARSVSAAFTRACKVLEITDLHFHDLRHEATSRLFERGYSIPEVAKFTLHLSWATLQRYTHLKTGDVPDRS